MLLTKNKKFILGSLITLGMVSPISISVSCGSVKKNLTDVQIISEIKSKILANKSIGLSNDVTKKTFDNAIRTSLKNSSISKLTTDEMSKVSFTTPENIEVLKDGISRHLALTIKTNTKTDKFSLFYYIKENKDHFKRNLPENISNIQSLTVSSYKTNLKETIINSFAKKAGLNSYQKNKLRFEEKKINGIKKGTAKPIKFYFLYDGINKLYIKQISITWNTDTNISSSIDSKLSSKTPPLFEVESYVTPINIKTSIINSIITKKQFTDFEKSILTINDLGSLKQDGKDHNVKIQFKISEIKTVEKNVKIKWKQSNENIISSIKRKIDSIKGELLLPVNTKHDLSLQLAAIKSALTDVKSANLSPGEKELLTITDTKALTKGIRQVTHIKITSGNKSEIISLAVLIPTDEFLVSSIQSKINNKNIILPKADLNSDNDKLSAIKTALKDSHIANISEYEANTLTFNKSSASSLSHNGESCYINLNITSNGKSITASINVIWPSNDEQLLNSVLQKMKIGDGSAKIGVRIPSGIIDSIENKAKSIKESLGNSTSANLTNSEQSLLNFNNHDLDSIKKGGKEVLVHATLSIGTNKKDIIINVLWEQW